jgi:hypothetical protein
MRAATEETAERHRLARLLRLEDPATLEPILAGVAAADIARYREDVVELLYGSVTGGLKGAAEVSRLLPVKTLAAIAHRALGPVICGRLVGLIDPHRAADVAGHLPIAFLAETAAELDPRRAGAVLGALDQETLVAAAVQMVRDGEHVALGRFVFHLDRIALHACIEAFPDVDLVRVGFVAEEKHRLGEVFALIDDERAAGLERVARDAGIEDQYRNVLTHLDAAARGRLDRRAA